MSEILSEGIQGEINKFVDKNTALMRDELVRRLRAHIDVCNSTLDEEQRVPLVDGYVAGVAERMLFPAE